MDGTYNRFGRRAAAIYAANNLKVRIISGDSGEFAKSGSRTIWLVHTTGTNWLTF